MFIVNSLDAGHSLDTEVNQWTVTVIFRIGNLLDLQQENIYIVIFLTNVNFSCKSRMAEF